MVHEEDPGEQNIPWLRNTALFIEENYGWIQVSKKKNITENC